MFWFGRRKSIWIISIAALAVFLLVAFPSLHEDADQSQTSEYLPYFAHIDLSQTTDFDLANFERWPRASEAVEVIIVELPTELAGKLGGSLPVAPDTHKIRLVDGYSLLVFESLSDSSAEPVILNTSLSQAVLDNTPENGFTVEHVKDDIYSLRVDEQFFKANRGRFYLVVFLDAETSQGLGLMSLRLSEQQTYENWPGALSVLGSGSSKDGPGATPSPTPIDKDECEGLKDGVPCGVSLEEKTACMECKNDKCVVNSGAPCAGTFDNKIREELNKECGVCGSDGHCTAPPDKTPCGGNEGSECGYCIEFQCAVGADRPCGWPSGNQNLDECKTGRCNRDGECIKKEAGYNCGEKGCGVCTLTNFGVVCLPRTPAPFCGGSIGYDPADGILPDPYSSHYECQVCVGLECKDEPANGLSCGNGGTCKWGSCRNELDGIIAGDANGDGVVNSGDLDVVRGDWGATCSIEEPCDGDLDGDGSVGSGDLDIIRGNWGASAPVAASAN